jgi:hypothetical protein
MKTISLPRSINLQPPRIPRPRLPRPIDIANITAKSPPPPPSPYAPPPSLSISNPNADNTDDLI